jgi:predicted TIM-barrel fold metal-dependent hydrolase
MIDGHCHLDKGIGSCDDAMEALYSEARACGIESVVLLNVPEIGFDNCEVMVKAREYGNFFHLFPSLSPMDSGVHDELHDMKSMGASGIKLHPRIHGYYIGSSQSVDLMKNAAGLGLPVMVDCFPDGRNMALGNMPQAFAAIAEHSPEITIAIAHAGGHHILDALMVAKFYRNVYLDLSFTLLYYRSSSVTRDILYAVRSLRSRKIFWGTDYPDRPYRTTVDMSMAEFKDMGLSEEEKDGLFNENVRVFLGKSDKMDCSGLK